MPLAAADDAAFARPEAKRLLAMVVVSIALHVLALRGLPLIGPAPAPTRELSAQLVHKPGPSREQAPSAAIEPERDAREHGRPADERRAAARPKPRANAEQKRAAAKRPSANSRQDPVGAEGEPVVSTPQAQAVAAPAPSSPLARSSALPPEHPVLARSVTAQAAQPALGHGLRSSQSTAPAAAAPADSLARGGAQTAATAASAARSGALIAAPVTVARDAQRATMAAPEAAQGEAELAQAEAAPALAASRHSETQVSSVEPTPSAAVAQASQPAPIPQAPTATPSTPEPNSAPPELARLEPTPSAPLPTPVARALPLPAVGEIAYLARWGIFSAKAAINWEFVDQRYRLNLLVKGTGLAAIAGQYNQTSEGQVGEHGLVPVSFVAESSRRKDTATFDWSNKQLKLVGKKGESVIELPERTQDTLSIMFQLAFEPPRGATHSTMVTNGRKLETYAWELRGEETLQLEGGSFKTLKVAKQRAANDSGLEIWLSTEHYYLPVKIVFVDKKGSPDLQLQVSNISLPENARN